MTEAITQKQYDLSFAYRFCWDRPEQVREALKVLLCDNLAELNAKDAQRPAISDSKRQMQEEVAKIRWLLAINPNTPPPVLEHLSKDSSSALLQRIAENPRVHITTLSRLSKHDDPQVRASVAENPSLSIKTIWRLVRDESPDVRLRLAESYSIPLAVLKVLMDDENPYVSSRAALTLKTLMGSINSLRVY